MTDIVLESKYACHFKGPTTASSVVHVGLNQQLHLIVACSFPETIQGAPARQYLQQPSTAVQRPASDARGPGAVLSSATGNAPVSGAASAAGKDTEPLGNLIAKVKSSRPAAKGMHASPKQATPKAPARDRRVAFQPHPQAEGEILGSSQQDAARDPKDSTELGMPKQATPGMLAARKAAAKRRRPESERDRPRRAAIEHVELRLKQLHADQQIGLGLDEMSQPWAGTGLVTSSQCCTSMMLLYRRMK